MEVKCIWTGIKNKKKSENTERSKNVWYSDVVFAFDGDGYISEGNVKVD